MAKGTKKTGGKAGPRAGEIITLPASEVRNNWNRQLEDIRLYEHRVIMTRYGEPKAVMVPLSDLDRLKRLDEAERGGRSTRNDPVPTE